MVRGVNRGDIFVDDDDRRKFLNRLSQLLVETQTVCFAWALMPNHLHLLLRPGARGLSHLMRRLLTGYAIYFNRRHERSGHLFQNRYQSIVCDENAYLLELIRYIHLNPLRAAVVNDLEALDLYPWTGHRILMGQGEFAGQVVDEVLGLFAEERSRGREKYREFVADGLDMGRRAELVGKRAGGDERAEGDVLKDQRILGDEKFLEKLREQKVFAVQPVARAPVEDIVRRVCEYYGVDPADIGKNIRTAQIAKARSVVCFLAVREAGHSGVRVGEQVNLGRAGVSRAAVRGAEVVRKNLGLLGLVDG